MNFATYADILRPAEKRNALLYDAMLVVTFSILIAISAQIAVPLPFSPVPVTGQTMAILLAGIMLGSRRGALAVLMYILEGAAGMPVFAGGKFGVLHLLGPSGGYLIGFVFAAYLVGLLAEKGWDRSPLKTAGAMIAGNIVLYIFGVMQLSIYTGINNAITMGIYPFIVGDIFKIALGTGLLPAGWKLFEMKRN